MQVIIIEGILPEGKFRFINTKDLEDFLKYENYDRTEVPRRDVRRCTTKNS